QVDMRVVGAESRGAALQYFTGSKQHNIALRDRALTAGLRLNEYGVFNVAEGTRLAGDSEEGVYEMLGLAWVPPELREGRGEIEAAERRTLPSLVQHADLRSDLHCHTTATDGKDDIHAMLRAARANGLEYLAITDHSRALAMANGLDEPRALAHAEAIRRAGADVGIGVLAGIECDILPDGSLDLSDACLQELDFVVASVHSAFQQDEATMTARLLRAIANPCVDVIGHPTGRLLLKRPPQQLNFEAVLDACAREGVALEINCQVDRLDLTDVHARRAAERGVRLTISSDAHSVAALTLLKWGVAVARRAWLTPADVLNTRSLDTLRASLRRHRHRA
ncbi:MAG: PHP domain-containing protein, partial [Vicinamibacterales bacterium]